MMPTDRPDDETIQDDEALDAWYEKYTREVAVAAAQARGAQTRGRPQNGGTWTNVSDVASRVRYSADEA